MICTFFNLKYISDIPVIDNLWFKSHSYHNILPQSSCLNPEFHILPVSDVVMRNNQHQKGCRNLRNYTNSWKAATPWYTKAQSEATHPPSLHPKQGTFLHPILLPACSAHRFFLGGLPTHTASWHLRPGVKILLRLSPVPYLLCATLTG